ncbi:MAG: MBL fold metallo-hydrolase [Planctomycetes bacterium]|nr:MBL fold metallo-hydrolase [Planctomycetota bacterium]
MPSRDDTLSRRDLLQQAGAGTLALAAGSFSRSASGEESGRSVTRLAEHLLVYHGPINAGVVRNGKKALLIDLGDGRVLGALAEMGIASVEQVLFTHHHRDQACGAHLLGDSVRISVPAAERDCFDKAADYWNNPKHRWHIYNQHPHHLMLAESIRVDAVLKDGDVVRWGPAQIRVLATPGHTDGSVSYLVEVDEKKVVFCGDAIYGEGQLWDLHSLQKGEQRGNLKLTDYHGYLGARRELVASLGRIGAGKPDVLVPSHGRIMTDPAKAIDTLVRRLEACYDKYVAISALRHYFPALFVEYAGRSGHMPIRKGKPAPEFLRHIATTWMIVAENKAAFVMDCGYEKVIQAIKDFMARGEVSTVEGIWVTHYHDDHVDAIPKFQEAFNCPCITDRAVAQVITDPPAWRLPCISPSKARVDRMTRDGETWQWQEFKMTAYWLPGQTLYHAGLLVEGHGARVFFVGDSFTAAGIDDYCMHNRTWLGRDTGFDRCIKLVEDLKPTHILNCHVDDAFDFTPQEGQFIRDNLAEREKLYGQLVPWDHANYGMDEPWVRCFPYEQKSAPGDAVEIRLVVTNHSSQPRTAIARAVLPRAWSKESPSSSDSGDDGNWSRKDVSPKTDGELALRLTVPAGVRPGRYVIPIDLRYGSWDLPQFTEAIVVI